MVPPKKSGQRPSKRRKSNNTLPSDFYVPLPTESANPTILVADLSRRLAACDIRQVAFTHTVYGKPKDPDDRADVALPKETLAAAHAGLKVYRRLHAVLESLADVAAFTNPSDSLLQDYDLVSIAPRNDGVFRSVVASAACDIITLDYTAHKAGLPYRIRPSEVKTMVERQIVVELPYATAVLQTPRRPAWVAVAADWQAASRAHPQARVLVTSSGERSTLEGKDATTLALRTPLDIQNLTTTVLGLRGVATADFVLQRAHQRRFRSTSIPRIDVGLEPVDTASAPKEDGPTKDTGNTQENASTDASDEEDAAGDGFMSF